MATKSFLKTIEIRDKSLGASFAEALTKCNNATTKEIEIKSNSLELKGTDAVKDFLDSFKK